MLEVDPALIVQNIYSNSELINEDKENSEIGLPKEDVLNQLNIIGRARIVLLNVANGMFQECHRNSSNC